VLNQLHPAGNMLAGALTAPAASVTAWRHRFAGHLLPTWTLVASFTGGWVLGCLRQQI
jgi:hypothetical protein